MQKKIVTILIFMLFATSILAPTRPVVAEGAVKIDFTATTYDLCMVAPEEFCQYGEFRLLPNGKGFLVGYQTIMMFDATDPRWDAKCYFVGNPFPPGNPKAYPVSGTFTCYPTNDDYAGGWWVGNVEEVIQPDRLIAHWNGKGYGLFDGLLVSVYNTMSSKYDGAAEGVTDVGVITELPGYEP